MEELKTNFGIFTNNAITGQTAQEVYEDWVLQRLKPPAQEIADAEFAIKTLTLLIEMEVI